MTFLGQVKSIVCLRAGLFLLCWLLYTIGLQHERDRLLLESSAFRQESAALTQELEANRLALERREAEKERLANENAALIAAINEVYTNDPDAKDWADTLCPDGVLDCLLK